jgi:hypothetical protein
VSCGFHQLSWHLVGRELTRHVARPWNHPNWIWNMTMMPERSPVARPRFRRAGTTAHLWKGLIEAAMSQAPQTDSHPRGARTAQKEHGDFWRFHHPFGRALGLQARQARSPPEAPQRPPEGPPNDCQAAPEPDLMQAARVIGEPDDAARSPVHDPLIWGAAGEIPLQPRRREERVRAVVAVGRPAGGRAAAVSSFFEIRRQTTFFAVSF